jgi:restriction system protein
VAVPDYETLMLPVLEYLSDGQVRKTAQLVSYIAERFKLSPDDLKQLIPSGRAKLLNNRVGWACTYLRKAGLISSPRRAYNQITDDGTRVLAGHPQKIDITFLQQFPKFRQFQEGNKATEKHEGKASAALTEQTPEEIIGAQSELINGSLAADLLEQIATMDPDAFEQLVVDLLLALGYGGTAEDAGRAIGKSNDGGIDGVIMEDVLGLDTIYIQAKKWKGTVPVKEVRDFAGALMSKRSGKGVFITTSNFPPSAEEFVKSVGVKIILIEGKRLASLMIKYNLGVTTTTTIEIKQLDSDYFAN